VRGLDRLLAFASRWFDPATVTNVFEPMLADWQREWLDANPTRRRLITVRGYAVFAMTVIAATPRLLFSPMPRDVLTRLTWRAGAFWIVSSALLFAPIAWRYADRPVPFGRWILLLPGVLVLTFPFAVMLGIDAIRRKDAGPNHVERRVALTVVLFATLWMVLAGGWLVPRSNYRWQDTARGLRELTTYELIVETPDTIPALHGTPRVREINNRLSLAMLPLLLVWIRWRSLAAGPTPAMRLPASVIVLAMGWAFMMLRRFDRELEAAFIAPGFGPWIALAVFVLAGLAEQHWRRRAHG
jgi:hypothetical protein